MVNLLIAGVGGQGTILLSRLIGASAMEAGLSVRGSETIGMAQRGGSVTSHVRMNDGDIYSPLIPMGKADVLIAFEPAEAVRALEFLKPEGHLIALNRAVQSVGSTYDIDIMLKYLSDNVRNLSVIDCGELLQKTQTAKAINVALLGTAVEKKLLPFDEKIAISVIEQRIPERFKEINITAFNIGRSMAD